MRENTAAPSVYISFLIRMWRDETNDEHESQADWQSEIEHIQSGRRWKFKSLNELLSFIHTQAQNPGRLAASSNE